MSERTRTDNETVEQQLVAYLDGELDPEQTSRLERLLSESPTVRQRLQQLQRAWDMLDLLPRAEVDESFTQTTIEMVALKAEGQARRGRPAIRWRSWLGWLSTALLVVLAGLAGYQLTARIRSAPERQLLRDLPVIENVDLYYNVDSIEFLRQLEQSGLFADDEGIEHSDETP